MTDLIDLISIVAIIAIWVVAIVRAQKVLSFDRVLGRGPVYTWFFMRSLFWTLSIVLFTLVAEAVFKDVEAEDIIDPAMTEIIN